MAKLFSERIDYFGPLDFTRTSIVTTTIKISLKMCSDPEMSSVATVLVSVSISTAVHSIVLFAGSSGGAASANAEPLRVTADAGGSALSANSPLAVLSRREVSASAFFKHINYYIVK